jgi:hypothetical protein
MKTFCTAASLSLLIGGCSVGMAVSGNHNPDLGAVRSGASRSEIEMHLGTPIKVASLGDGQEAATYQYEIGDEPSAGRAIGHGVMDVLTLGLWEVVGTPIEGFQGETHQITVTYESDRAVAVRGHQQGRSSNATHHAASGDSHRFRREYRQFGGGVWAN